jgi:hypothetical protein
VQRLAGNVIEASGDIAAIRYEFEEQRLAMHLTNKTDQDLVFFVVLNGIVGAVLVDGGDLQDTPLQGDYSHLMDGLFLVGSQERRLKRRGRKDAEGRREYLSTLSPCSCYKRFKLSQCASF